MHWSSMVHLHRRRTRMCWSAGWGRKRYGDGQELATDWVLPENLGVATESGTDGGFATDGESSSGGGLSSEGGVDECEDDIEESIS